MSCEQVVLHPHVLSQCLVGRAGEVEHSPLDLLAPAPFATAGREREVWVRLPRVGRLVRMSHVVASLSTVQVMADNCRLNPGGCRFDNREPNGCQFGCQ